MIEQKFKVALLLYLYNKIGSCLSYVLLRIILDMFSGECLGASLKVLDSNFVTCKQFCYV